MLGSLADAEDVVQETFIRWKLADRSSVASPRAFLVTITSRLCIDFLDSARVRREQYIGPWLPEPLVTGSGAAFSLSPAADDSLSMAFLLVMERLGPMERAVFLLREVFDYEYEEIAAIVGQTQPTCRQILHRAKQHVAQKRPRFRPSAEERDRIFQQFLDAAAGGDMDGLLAVLHEDVVLYADGGGKSRAVPRPVCGAGKVARFILIAPRKLLPKQLVRRRAAINDQPAIVSYLNGHPHSVFTAEMNGGRMRSIYIISNPEKLSRLPHLPGPPC